ncbi:MAG: metal ABC transporter permease [Ruminiclostridium sp.]|nr:metal ABC transporter permease [Ruminiclostridium sp.]
MINVIQGIMEAVQYDFILKALLVGSLIATCCSILGVFLVLKKFSLIGDGLAHVSFASVAVALLFAASPLLISIPMVIVASFIILKLNEKADLHGDAAIGLVSSFSIAAGVLIASLANGFNVDLMSYLFGSILVISDVDIVISIILSAAVIILVLLFYNNLFAITYDEEFARVAGLNTRLMNYLIAVLTSVTIAIGIRIVGTMLISSLIVFPTVTALQISKGFKGTMVISAVVSVSCVISGVFLSYLFNLPTGAAIVMLNTVIFLAFFCIKRLNII